MATSASQTYIAKLGFQDKDRSVDRHGLACEYLFERLLEMEMAPYLNEARLSYLYGAVERAQASLQATNDELVRNQKHGDSCDGWYRDQIPALQKRAEQEYDHWQAAVFDLDTFPQSFGLESARNELKAAYCINQPIKQSGRSYVIGFADVFIDHYGKRLLGEVKITKQSAESILQQVNFYELHLRPQTTYILTDFDCSDLQRMVEGTHIKVFRLGRRFEQWLASRTQFQSDEL